MNDAPGIIVHFTFESSQVVGVAEHEASFVTLHVGSVDVAHVPPFKLTTSVIEVVFQPPDVVAESSKISG